MRDQAFFSGIQKSIRVQRYILGTLFVALCVLAFVSTVFSQASANTQNIGQFANSCPSLTPVLASPNQIAPPTGTAFACVTSSATATATVTATPDLQLKTLKSAIRPNGVTPFVIINTSGIIVDNFNQELPLSQNPTRYPTDGTCTLAKAILAVNTHSQVDTCHGDLYTTIVLMNGYYIIAQADNTTGSFGSYDGLPPITGNSATGYQVTIEGNNSTIASGSEGSANKFRLFDVGTSAKVTFKNITFSYAFIVYGGGGAIYNTGILSIIGCVFNNAGGTGSGSGIYNAPSGNMNINSSSFANNQGYYGGAITNSGSANIMDSSFIGNTSSFYGGAIYNIGSGSVSISNTALINNASGPSLSGGAIYNNSSGASSVHKSCFIHNPSGATPTLSQAISNNGGVFDANSNWWNHPTGTFQAGGTDGRPGPVGPNTDPNSDNISFNVTWSPALATTPNYCQARNPRGQQWPGLFRPSNNTFYLLVGDSTAAQILTVPFGSGTDSVPVIGNWTGDGLGGVGLDKVGIYHTSTHTFSLCTADIDGTIPSSYPCSVSSNILNFSFGAANDQPMAGHWSPGASHDGVGVFRSSSGVQYLSNQIPPTGVDYATIYGIPSDLPVSGDWTGSGTDTIGIYRPSNQTFYLVTNAMCNCSMYADYTFSLGTNINTIPVIGDWLGYGYSSVGLYDNLTKFTLQTVLNNSGTDFTFGPFGTAHDLPVAGRWVAQCTTPPNGNSIQSGLLTVCRGPILPTATITPTPTYVPTLSTNAQITAYAQTATAVQTAISAGKCVLQAQQINGTVVPLMNNDLATIAPSGVQISPNSIFIPGTGRGSSSNNRATPANMSYYSVQYYGQPGWIYTGYGFAILGNSGACEYSILPTQVSNYQVPSTLQPAPIYVPTVQITTTPAQTPVPGSTLDCAGGDCTSGNQQVLYDTFVNQFVSKYYRPPTINDMLALTIYEEWFTSIDSQQANADGSEGLSRNYYVDCKYNTCVPGPGKLLVFLGGYAHWRTTSANVANAAQILINDYGNYLSLDKGPIDLLVLKILSPPPSSGWVDGLTAANGHPWQWWTYNCSAGSGRNTIGTLDTDLLFYQGYTDRLGSHRFEIYTPGQNGSLPPQAQRC